MNYELSSVAAESANEIRKMVASVADGVFLPKNGVSAAAESVFDM
jgi:hypothetical protein